ncbi:MAG: hypothetical protein ACRD5M_02925 [Candidatus Acidiferrales bacterium]
MDKHYVARILMAAILLLGIFVIAGCGSGVEGTYSNESGLAMLDLKSGGNAVFTALGTTNQCKYKVDRSKIGLACADQKLNLTVHDDGSITADGTFIGAMRKAKK